MVDIHGQHEHQSLLRHDMQKRLLDTHAGNEQSLRKLGGLFRKWSDLKATVASLDAEREEREARIELLRFQTRELSELELARDEIDALEEEQQRLANVEQLRQISNGIYVDLYENDDSALYSRLGKHVNALDELTLLDPELGEWRELIVSAQVQIAEAANGLRRYASELEHDPQRLEWLEQRISQIHDLARKHRVPPTELPQRHKTLESELNTLESPAQDPQKLSEELGKVEVNYHRLAELIHRSRAAAAEFLSEKTTAAMQELGMKGGRFAIDVLPTERTQFSTSGLDRIEFLGLGKSRPAHASTQQSSVRWRIVKDQPGDTDGGGE